jgi:hypothetical protein
MADKIPVDNRWLEALKEFRRTHRGRNPNSYEIARLKESLKNN